MDRIYLLKLSLSGIKNIEKTITLNFYKKTINRMFDPDEYRVKAIYGENGSGKTAIITAVKILKDIIEIPGYLGDFKTQELLREVINKKTKRLSMECEFLSRESDRAEIDDGKAPDRERSYDNKIYKYSLELSLNKNIDITKEALVYRNGNYSNSNWKLLYQIEEGRLIQVDADKDMISHLELISMNLLKRTSFVALIIENINYRLLEATITLHCITMLVFAASIKIYLNEEDQHELYLLKKTVEDLPNDESHKEIMKVKGLEEYINASTTKVPKKHYDQYVRKIERLQLFLQVFKSDIQSVEIERKEDGDFYICGLNLNYGQYMINMEFESTGIRKLVRVFDCLDLASSGGIVFIDELDSNINTVYLSKVIEYLMYYGNGQLCFTTHNLDLMDVLKENKNSIEFLSSDNRIISWVSHGNAVPMNNYKNGMIEGSPYNVSPSDFIGILGEE